MDDLLALERRVASEVVAEIGPSEPVDDLAIYTGIVAADQSPEWRLQSMFSATRFAVAAIIMALVGGLLLIAQPQDRVAETGPAADTESLPPLTGPAGNGLIAFSRDGDIYVGDPVTGESEAIVAGPRYDMAPAFSPDGSLLAFTRCQEGYDREDYERGGDCHATTMVVRPDGSDGRVVTGGGLWSPDGRSFVMYERDEPTGTVRLFDAFGDAPPRTLTLPTLDLRWGGPSFAGYSGVATFMRPPLGDRILAWSIDGRPGYLDVMDADGSNAQRLIDETWMTVNGFSWLDTPSWSPDGSRIAFDAWSDEESLGAVVVMDAAGDDLRVYAGGGSLGSWSPDGAKFLSERRCDTSDACGDLLITTDMATGLEREVATVPYLDRKWWSPDGTSILYTAGEPQGRMYTVDVETREVTALPAEWDTGYPGPSWQRIAAD